MSVDQVNEIGQGRVWSGTEAVKNGLVDEIGGLDAAIRYAGKKADLGEHFKVTEFPRSRNFSEAVAEALGKFTPSSLHIQQQQTGLVGELTARITSELSFLQSLNDPNGVYARMPVELQIR
jgi:protease-4